MGDNMDIDGELGDNGEQFVCAQCGGAANQRCTGCHITFYCSRDHQKQHWKKHKSSCCAYKVCSSPELGRYLVATRDLKPGEMVISETPLVIGPQAVTIPICLACYKPANSKFACGKCGWPMCNANCAKSAVHEAECSLTAARGSPLQMPANCFNKPYPIYEVVAILRCLHLKQSSDAKWKKLKELEPHEEPRKKNGKYDKDTATMVRVVREFLKIPDTVFTTQEILDVCGVLNVNAHELPVTPTPTQALYANISILEHSCINNASKHFDGDFRVVIRAAVNIKKGEHISINYSDPMWGTNSRQLHLAETKYFTCKCVRCADPTELGTMFSSIRCPQCTAEQGGYLVSTDPGAGPDSQADWRCIVCSKIQPHTFVDAVTQSIGEELVMLEKGSVEACQAFIRKHSQNLHPNHYYLQDIKLALCQMIGQSATGQGHEIFNLTEKELLYKQKIGMELLEVANRISPGISRLRGVILYELQATLAAYARRKFSSGEISTDHMRNVMKEVKKYLLECIQIFSFEPPCLQEGRLATIARLDLLELETFLDSLEQKV
eukprot:GFUD01042416.1.p1 GENE.GFUD01042416.1~~GFUD01042416.1.p1  ORF type:complete len:551 (+),score=82.13 GFUD01042416.1:176-1828(+)